MLTIQACGRVVTVRLTCIQYCARTMLSVFAKFKYRVRSSQRIWRARRCVGTSFALGYLVYTCRWCVCSACWLARVDALCRLWSSLEPAIRLEYTTAANNQASRKPIPSLGREIRLTSLCVCVCDAQRSDELWESSVGALLSRMHAEFAPDSTAMASLTPLTQFMLRSRHVRTHLMA